MPSKTQKPKKISATPIGNSDSLAKRTKKGDKISEKKQDKSFAISVIDEMSQLFFASAGTIYHKLKHGLKIEEPFYVPGADSHYQQLIGKTADDILRFIQKVRPGGIYSVSMCFTAKDVINKDTQEKRDGFWVPYCFKASHSDLVCSVKAIPARVKFENNKWKYCKEPAKRIIDKEGQSDRINVDMIDMPHGGISLSERFINQIDKLEDDGQYSILSTENYKSSVGYFLLTGNNIDLEFNDGTDGQQDANGKYKYLPTKIRQRSQVVIVPIECQGNQTGDQPKRIGYLQVTGYNYSNGENGKYINSECSKDLMNKSIILNADENDELIISTLKCYANYIVLTNKIESLKKVSVKTTWSL